MLNKIWEDGENEGLAQEIVDALQCEHGISDSWDMEEISDPHIPVNEQLKL